MAPSKKTLARMSELTDGDVRTRRAAARKLRSRAAVAPLCQALRDTNWQVRRNAASSLGQIGAPEAVDPLIAALYDKCRGVRRRAITALGRLGDARAVLPLCSLLRDEKPGIRGTVQDALIRIGAPAIPDLRRLLEAEQDDALKRSLHPHLVFVLREMANGKASLLPQEVLLLDLPPAERCACLQALHLYARPALRDYIGFRTRGFPLLACLDARTVCEQVLTAESEALRESARAVLDYMTLARASERDPASERNLLLRGAAPSAAEQDGTRLLRGSALPAEMPSGSPPLVTRLKRWLGRKA